ncbi:hypothetical protein FNF29_04894 [Cafeteria roenbergensis]|uniref:PDEase domain-containing protein n=1 Tax=Cafeteria roenbergensis TaxID=33653 RepID=A0A5A8CEL4_CAFRO|nr:hypothetical protein FNF29_04894 [Cafeteria roenbergensis]|eukprot:KAA0151004.1 hypothetical protein FNF29_04894 [Cafeteria roenbergensis]
MAFVVASGLSTQALLRESTTARVAEILTDTVVSSFNSALSGTVVDVTLRLAQAAEAGNLTTLHDQGATLSHRRHEPPHFARVDAINYLSTTAGAVPKARLAQIAFVDGSFMAVGYLDSESFTNVPSGWTGGLAYLQRPADESGFPGVGTVTAYAPELAVEAGEAARTNTSSLLPASIATRENFDPRDELWYRLAMRAARELNDAVEGGAEGVAHGVSDEVVWTPIANLSFAQIAPDGRVIHVGTTASTALRNPTTGEVIGVLCMDVGAEDALAGTLHDLAKRLYRLRTRTHLSLVEPYSKCTVASSVTRQVFLPLDSGTCSDVHGALLVGAPLDHVTGIAIEASRRLIAAANASAAELDPIDRRAFRTAYNLSDSNQVPFDIALPSVFGVLGPAMQDTSAVVGDVENSRNALLRSTKQDLVEEPYSLDTELKGPDAVAVADRHVIPNAALYGETSYGVINAFLQLPPLSTMMLVIAIDERDLGKYAGLPATITSGAIAVVLSMLVSVALVVLGSQLGGESSDSDQEMDVILSDLVSPDAIDAGTAPVAMALRLLSKMKRRLPLDRETRRYVSRLTDLMKRAGDGAYMPAAFEDVIGNGHDLGGAMSRTTSGDGTTTGEQFADEADDVTATRNRGVASSDSGDEGGQQSGSAGAGAGAGAGGVDMTGDVTMVESTLDGDVDLEGLWSRHLSVDDVMSSYLPPALCCAVRDATSLSAPAYLFTPALLAASQRIQEWLRQGAAVTRAEELSFDQECGAKLAALDAVLTASQCAVDGSVIRGDRSERMLMLGDTGPITFQSGTSLTGGGNSSSGGGGGGGVGLRAGSGNGSGSTVTPLGVTGPGGGWRSKQPLGAKGRGSSKLLVLGGLPAAGLARSPVRSGSTRTKSGRDIARGTSASDLLASASEATEGDDDGEVIGDGRVAGDSIDGMRVEPASASANSADMAEVQGGVNTTATAADVLTAAADSVGESRPGHQRVTSSSSSIAGLATAEAILSGDVDPRDALMLRPPQHRPPALSALPGVFEIASASLQQWSWSIFDFVNNHCRSNFLPAVGLATLRSWGTLERLHVPEVPVALYLSAVERAYRSPSYHNSLHGTDATHSMTWLLHSRRFDCLSDVERFAGVIAPAIHDVAHPGVNTGYLTSSGSRLALRYNDTSPLESFHVAASFELAAAMGDASPLLALAESDRAYARSLIIEIVLGTDMSRSMELTAKFVTAVSEADPVWKRMRRHHGDAGLTRVRIRPSLPGDVDVDNASGSDGVGSAGETGAGVVVPVRLALAAGRSRRRVAAAAAASATRGDGGSSPANRGGGSNLGGVSGASVASSYRRDDNGDLVVPALENVTTAMVFAMKCADIGHCCKPFDQHQEWSRRVVLEFCLQGRREAEAGGSPPPFMDEANLHTTHSSQAGFLGFVAVPMWRKLADWLPEASEPLAVAEANKATWDEVAFRGDEVERRVEGLARAGPENSGAMAAAVTANPTLDPMCAADLRKGLSENVTALIGTVAAPGDEDLHRFVGATMAMYHQQVIDEAAARAAAEQR